MLLHHGQQVLDITLNPTHSPALTVKRKGKVIWQGIEADWKPWKLVVTDIDNNGKEDFIVALYKHTRHSPNRLHTVHVYGYNGTEIIAKWRGSRLARDFVEMTVQKTKKGYMLFTLDRLLDGRFTLSCYTWSGFGFRKMWERGSWKKARLQEGGNYLITVATEGGPVKLSTEG